MKRRDLLKQITLGGTILITTPLAFTACETEDKNPDQGTDGNGDFLLTLDLSEASNATLKNAGGFVVKGKIIVVNTGEGYIALSSECTHDGCTVSFNPSAGNFPCPCHVSVFNKNGSVLNGPAVNPLTVYKVTQSEGVLNIG